MNYQKIYDDIVNRGKTRILEGYTEKHHIIPKCMGGTDEECNLVKLTAREHFLVHAFLCEIYPSNKKLHFAFWSMSNLRGEQHERNYKIGSRLYEYHPTEK